MAATMQISITHDLHKVTKHLNALQQKHVPYAASQAINDTAKDAQHAVQAQAEQKLDRPTKQTINAFRVKYANKRNLVGEVFIPPWAYEYLKYQIEGGKRPVRGKGTGVPTPNARLNQYGNIPNRKRGLIKNKNQFIATIRGILGVWERGHYSKRGKFTSKGNSRSTAIRLIVAIERDVQYKPRLPFPRIVQGVVQNKFARHFSKRMQAALATAR